MERHKPMVLKARIHKDLMPYKDSFWFGMATFALLGRPAKRYRPDETRRGDQRMFTRTLSPREEDYFNEIHSASSATQVALIESFLLSAARFQNPEQFLNKGSVVCPVLAALSAFQDLDHAT